MAVQGFDYNGWADYDNEVSGSRVNATALTAANFDAQGSLRAAYHAGIAGIVNGVLVTQQYGNFEHPAVGPAAAAATQRELKWRVDFHDNVTKKKYKIELPCADTSVLDANDRAHAAIGDAGAVDAFVEAMEDYVLSDVGNAIIVDEITLVGRLL